MFNGTKETEGREETFSEEMCMSIKKWDLKDWSTSYVTQVQKVIKLMLSKKYQGLGNISYQEVSNQLNEAWNFGGKKNLHSSRSKLLKRYTL